MEDDIFVDMPPEETFTFKMMSPEKLNALVAERNQLREDLNAVLDDVYGNEGDFPSYSKLLAERDQLREELNQLQAEVEELRGEGIFKHAAKLEERVAYLESVIMQDGGVIVDWYKRAVEVGEENDRLKAAYTRLAERLKLATPQSLMEVMRDEEAE